MRAEDPFEGEMLGLLGELDGCQYEPAAHPEREGLIDGVLEEVGEALELLVSTIGLLRPAWPLRPTAEEAVLCLCGEPPEREGDWAGLALHLRVAMLGERGLGVGAC